MAGAHRTRPHHDKWRSADCCRTCAPPHRSGPGYPPDGMNLLPASRATPRCRAKTVLALQGECTRRTHRRLSSSKSSTTLLFNVVEDPLERGNLKERRKDVYERLSRGWRNASMLPEIAEQHAHSPRQSCRPLWLAESKRAPDPFAFASRLSRGDHRMDLLLPATPHLMRGIE